MTKEGLIWAHSSGRASVHHEEAAGIVAGMEAGAAG